MQKIQKKLTKKLNKPKVPAEGGTKPGVLRIDDLPKNFTEKHLGDYFRTISSISRVRIVRSEKTGQSKGFGYVKFKDLQDAEHIAKKKDIIFNKKALKAQCVPWVDIPKGLFKKRLPAKDKLQEKQPLQDSETGNERKFSCNKLQSKLKKMQNKLATLGVNYDLTIFDEIKTVLPSSVSNKKQTDAKIKLEPKQSVSKDSIKQEPAVKKELDSEDSESDETSSIDEIVHKKENGKQSSKNLVDKKKGGGIQKQIVKINKKEAPVVSKNKKLQLAAAELMKVQEVPKVKDQKLKIKSIKNKNKK